MRDALLADGLRSGMLQGLGVLDGLGCIAGSLQNL